MKTKISIAAIWIITLFYVDLAYGYYPVSPYAFCNNNPLRYVDPDGRKWVDANGNTMWRNGRWTNYATPEAMRVGVAMRATETGRKTFNQVANNPSAIQVVISPKVKIGETGTTLTRGEFIPGEGRRVMILETGEMYPESGTIMIYEGSIKAEINGIIPSEGKTANLIKSLPSDVAVDGTIGSVAVHEGIHITPKNIQQQVENNQAEKSGQSKLHNIEIDPEQHQDQHLKELLNK